MGRSVWSGSGAVLAGLVLLAVGAPALAQEGPLKAHRTGTAVALGVGMATSDGMAGPTGRASVHYRFGGNYAVGPSLTLASISDSSDLFPPGPEGKFGAVGLDLQARTYVDRTTGWAMVSPFVARYQTDDLLSTSPTPQGFEYVRGEGTRLGVEVAAGVELQVLQWLALSASGRVMISPLGPDVEGAADGEAQRARTAFLFHLGPVLTF